MAALSFLRKDFNVRVRYANFEVPLPSDPTVRDGFLALFPRGVEPVPESMRHGYVNPTKSIDDFCIYVLDHFQLRRKTLCGLLYCTSEECAHRRGERLRIFKRTECRNSKSLEQATTDHHLPNGSYKSLTYELANMRVLCQRCHTKRTQCWTSNNTRGAQVPWEEQDLESKRMLLAVGKAKACVDYQSLQCAKQNLAKRRTNEEQSFDRWEASKQVVCSTMDARGSRPSAL